MRSSGSLKCWGDDSSGQLGIAPGSPGPAPPSVLGGGAFTHAFTSGTGTPSGAFAVTAGSLPPGLALSPAGVLSGSPTQAGSFSFTVSAQNLIGSASAQFTITVD